eukprot:2825277-Rhodomonas_salina.1
MRHRPPQSAITVRAVRYHPTHSPLSPYAQSAITLRAVAAANAQEAVLKTGIFVPGSSTEHGYTVPGSSTEHGYIVPGSSTEHGYTVPGSRASTGNLCLRSQSGGRRHVQRQRLNAIDLTVADASVSHSSWLCVCHGVCVS